jgi:hypothetical protein
MDRERYEENTILMNTQYLTEEVLVMISGVRPLPKIV